MSQLRLLRGKTGEIRTAKFNEKTHMVVPVVALVEGVISASNSDGPELVLAEKFGFAPAGWNGRPVMVSHPQRNGKMIPANVPEVLEMESIGHTFNTLVEDKKLKMEAWIDIAKARALGGEAEKIVDRLDAGEQVEVSIGAYISLVKEKGTFNGVDYTGIWDQIMPEHLAMLLADETGACSIEMGCGAPRAASAKEEAVNLTKELYEEFMGLLGFRAALTDDDKRQALGLILQAELGDRFYGVHSITDKNTVAYHATSPDGRGIQLYEQPFKGPRAGKFTLDGSPVAVRTQTDLIPLSAPTDDTPAASVAEARAACGCGGSHETTTTITLTGDDTMKTIKERVAALIASDKNQFSEDHRVVLETCSAEQLDILERHETKVVEKIVEKPVAAELTEEIVYAKFPGIKAVVDQHEARQAAQKKQLITQLTGASQAFTPEELEPKSVDELSKMAVLAGINKTADVLDFTGKGLPRAASEDRSVPKPPSLVDAIQKTGTNS